MKYSSNDNGSMSPRFGFFMAILYAFLLPTSTLGQSCIDDIEDIYKKEALVTDTSIPRLYIVCPRSIYEIGNLDFDGNLIQPKVGSVMPPLPLRPNLTIRCGDNGSRDNTCWLRGGDLQMDGTKVRGIQDDTVENVKIEGFVFLGAREHSLLANKPGDITFRDCEFREFTTSTVPIMLDYYDSFNPSKELLVSFDECDFRDNRYFGMGSQSALIYGNNAQNRIKIEFSSFENNDMVWNNTRPDTHSYIVESLGPVELLKSCFKDNLVGSSDVAVFGSTLENELNFVSNSSGVLCPFASVFETMDQFASFKPTCMEATSRGCARYPTESPTTSPTSSPTISPKPSPAPTENPTISSRPTVSKMPSGQPSEAPSMNPTDKQATKSPTAAPIDFDFYFESPSAAVAHRANAMLLLFSTASMYYFFL